MSADFDLEQRFQDMIAMVGTRLLLDPVAVALDPELSNRKTNMRRTMMPILLLALPALASAGELYGKITAGGAAVGAGIGVAAKCGGKAYPAVQTDGTGSFHLVVDETGKCSLTVTRNGLSASLDVVSYEEGAQADIVLDSKDGKLSARRK